MTAKTIAVDFDGTIIQNGFFPGAGPLNPGAKEILTRLSDLGFRIIVYSCRTCTWCLEEYPDAVGQKAHDRLGYKTMKTLLDKAHIPYDEIDMGDKGKPLADYYVDDKAIRFDLKEGGWNNVFSIIQLHEQAHYRITSNVSGSNWTKFKRALSTLFARTRNT